MKLIKFLGAAIVFTFPLISLQGIDECLCFVLSIDRRGVLVFSKVVQSCSTSFHSSYGSTLLGSFPLL
jgi:hypothetical protein